MRLPRLKHTWEEGLHFYDVFCLSSTFLSCTLTCQQAVCRQSCQVCKQKQIMHCMYKRMGKVMNACQGQKAIYRMYERKRDVVRNG